jgi:hypothetical protein
MGFWMGFRRAEAISRANAVGRITTPIDVPPTGAPGRVTTPI